MSCSRLIFVIRYPGRTLGFLAILFLLTCVLTSESISANENAFEIYQGQNGNYQIVLGILPEEPLVGVVQFSIVLTDSATGRFVDDATVIVVVEDQDGIPTYQSVAIAMPDGSDFYVANVTFQKAGIWNVLVSADNEELGLAEFSSPLEIGELAIGMSDMGTFVWLGIVVIIFGGGYWIYRSAMRRRPRPD